MTDLVSHDVSHDPSPFAGGRVHLFSENEHCKVPIAHQFGETSSLPFEICHSCNTYCLLLPPVVIVPVASTVPMFSEKARLANLVHIAHIGRLWDSTCCSGGRGREGALKLITLIYR